VPRNAAE